MAAKILKPTIVYIIISLNIYCFPIKTVLQRSFNLYRQILICLDDHYKIIDTETPIE